VNGAHISGRFRRAAIAVMLVVGCVFAGVARGQQQRPAAPRPAVRMGQGPGARPGGGLGPGSGARMSNRQLQQEWRAARQGQPMPNRQGQMGPGGGYGAQAGRPVYQNPGAGNPNFGGQRPAYGGVQQPGYGQQQPGYGQQQRPAYGNVQQPGYGQQQRPAYGAQGAAAPQGHLEDWLNQHRNVPVQDQQRMLSNDPSFRRLPSADQQRLTQQLQQVNRLPEQQRDRRLERNEMLERLSPQDRMSLNRSGHQWAALPQDRQAMMKQAFQNLRGVPLDQRDTVLNSARYQGTFSPQERGILSDFLKVEPYEPQR